MDYFLLLLSGFMLGFIVGETLLAFRINRALLKHGVSSKEISKPLVIKPHVFKLFIEDEQGILYLFDHEKNEFVCQAKTVEDLAKLAKEYKNIEYAAVLHGEDTYMFINGMVKIKDES